jgi:hypothetical protein
MLLYIWFQRKLWPPLATILNFRWAQKVTRPVKDFKMNIQITFPYHRFSVSSYRIWNQLAFAYGQPMRNCSSALNLSVVCILTRNCTEGSGVCLDRMRDCFWFVNKWSSGDIGNDLNSISIWNTCEYGIIVLPLSVDQSKKMEANAFIKMAQFYNNLIMQRSVCLDRMRDCFWFVNKWSSGDIGNIVSFSIIFFQEPLKPRSHIRLGS